MISLEIIVTPAVGKKVELEQSIVYFQNSIEDVSSQFEVVTTEKENFRFLFNFETKEEAKFLLESANFTLLSGAIQTLCNQHSLTLNDKENNINLLNCKNFAKIKNYLIIKEKENAS